MSICRRDILLGAIGALGSQTAKCAVANRIAPDRVVRTVAELHTACRSGGRYLVQPGIYVLGDQILRPVSRTHLIGTPGQTILRKTTSSGPYRLRAFFDIEDAKSITLEGLVLDHYARRTEHGMIVRSSSPGASKNIVMRNCELRQCHVHIERYVDGVTIADTRFLGGGVALAAVATGGQISKRDGKGINSDGAVRNIRLERLYIERTYTEAIDINWHTHDLFARAIHTYNCDVGGADEVIDIGGDVNTSSANACRNIHFEDVTIENDLRGPSRTIAIHVKGQSQGVTLRRIRIRRRSSTGSTAGVRIWNTNQTTVEDLTVEGCAYGVVSAAEGRQTPRAIRLRRVAVRNFDRDAIQLEGRDIMLEDFDVDGTGAAGVGVELVETSGAVIRNGKIRTAGAPGLRALASTTNVAIDNVAVDGRQRGKGFEIRSGGVQFTTDGS